MDAWNGSSVFVTGAASGIGRALARAASARGAAVRVADLDAEGAQRVAAECGPAATWCQLDVRDADAVRGAVEGFARERGRLDFLFNNAGVGVGGEAHEIPLTDWRRAIDVNVYGVVHGVLAAYPLMVRQGSGHILNTASLAGLAPAPLLAPYALTKHAVVGLSTSLRVEAAAHGVRVSVLCPGVIETPILDKGIPADSAIPWIPDVRRYLTKMSGPPYPVERCAQETLAALERNDAVIVMPARARFGWRLGRLFPGLIERAAAPAVAVERSQRAAAPHGPAFDPGSAQPSPVASRPE